MEDSILKTVYNYYPKHIGFLDGTRNINNKYLESKEHQNITTRLTELCKQNNNALRVTTTKILNEVSKKLEIRDVSRVCQEDRATCLQHSGFYNEQDKIFKPICFVFSTLAPYYHGYMMEINLVEDHSSNAFKYRWDRIYGPIINWQDNANYAVVYDIIKEVIRKFSNYKEFPKELVNEVIPNISKNNIEFGEMTYFNAFFLDNFFCYP